VPTAPRTQKCSSKNARKRLETAKKHFEERQYRGVLVAVQHALKRRALPIADLAVSIFRDGVHRCADPKVAVGVPVVLAVEEGKREVERIPGVARAVELAFRLVKRGIDYVLRLLLERARGERPRASDELRRLKELLDSITGFIADHGKDRHLKDEALKYACDVSGALSWALGEIDTERFTGSDFNMDRLVAIVREIERKSGVRLDRY